MADFVAERVVVELLGKTEQFDTKTAQSAAGFEGSMGRIEKAAVSAETTVARSSDARVAALRKESAQISAAARLLGTQINDVGHLMNGQNSPFVIPQKQAPAVGRAFTLLSAGASALGGVMGGILVSAVLAAAGAWVEYLLKSKDANAEIQDMVEKLQEQARKAKLTEAAQHAFALTLEGVTKALDDNEKALKSLNQEQETAAFKALKQANLQSLILQGIRERTLATLEEAKAIIERNRAQAQFADKPGLRTALTGEADAAAKRVAELEAKIKSIDASASRAADQHRIALDKLAVEIGSRDPIEQIKVSYDRLIDATEKRLRGEGKTTAEILKQTKALREQQRLEEEAARKKPSTADPKLPKVTQAEVISLLKDVFGSGTQITSTTRSAARNKLAGGAANSFHLTGQAIDFIPQGGVTAFDKEMLRLAAEARGIKLIEILRPGDKGHEDHGHVAFARARLTPDQVAAAQERSAKAAQIAADAELRRVQLFQNEQANLEGQVIDARQSLVESAEEIAKLELQAIEISRQKYADNLASLVDQRKLTQAEADELAKLNEERAKLRAELVQRREDQRKFRVREAEAERILARQQGGIANEQDLLQSREGIATTAKQRHDLERKLIDLSFQEERLQLQAVIAHAERLRIELERIKTLRALSDEEKAELQRAQDQAELAQQRLDSQGERQANAQTGNDRANATPLQDFFQQIPDTADEINQAFEDIAAGGLATFTDALTDAIVNFRSLGDVGRAVLQNITAALVKMAIQQLLLHTVGKLIGQTATAATTAEAGAAAAAWAPAAALASLATLGANAGPAAAAIAGITALTAGIAAASSVAGLGGFASGGYTGDGAVNSPAGIVHRREFVFDAPATARIGVANLEAMRRGVTPSNAKAASPRGGGATLSAEAVAQLGGIVSKAIEAMPDVALYPTLDPVDVIDAALSSPRGFQRFLVHLGDNRGAVTSTLQ